MLFFFPVFSLSLFGIVFSSYTYTPNQPLPTHKQYYQDAHVVATEESKDAEEAVTGAKDDTSDINDTGAELIEVGGSTQLGKQTAAQIRAVQAKARVFMRTFARKAKALQRILVARMQVCLERHHLVSLLLDVVCDSPLFSLFFFVLVFLFVLVLFLFVLLVLSRS